MQQFHCNLILVCALLLHVTTAHRPDTVYWPFGQTVDAGIVMSTRFLAQNYTMQVADDFVVPPGIANGLITADITSDITHAHYLRDSPILPLLW
jgi:hypothetical protein